MISRANTKNIIYYVCLYLVAGVLLLSGISKIIDPMPLIEMLKLVVGLPEEFLIILATILPIIEIGLSLLLVLKTKPKPVQLATLVLFGAFLIFSIYGTIAGMNNNCGCFGGLIKSEIGWGMVGRNVLLLMVAAYITKKRAI